VSIDADLKDGGVSVRDRFLTPAQIRALAECARLRRARGDFDAARIGSERSLQRREDIRGDATCWIVPPLSPAEQMLLEELERLRLELNREALLGLFELELHYAWYPPGAGYARHVDQPQGRAQRRVSLVLYLNENWTPGAGGELRIFDAAGGGRDGADSAAHGRCDSAGHGRPDMPTERYRDIEPIAGRLVCFLTPGREHAVLPTQRDRLSISGWFRTRD
jgi:SM-20-related protein